MNGETLAVYCWTSAFFGMIVAWTLATGQSIIRFNGNGKRPLRNGRGRDSEFDREKHLGWKKKKQPVQDICNDLLDRKQTIAEYQQKFEFGSDANDVSKIRILAMLDGPFVSFQDFGLCPVQGRNLTDWDDLADFLFRRHRVSVNENNATVKTVMTFQTGNLHSWVNKMMMNFQIFKCEKIRFSATRQLERMSVCGETG